MSKRHLSGKAINPIALTGQESLAEVISQTFTAYNAGRLREGCELLVQKMLQPDVTVGMSLSGALTPGGFGKSCLVPLIEAAAPGVPNARWIAIRLLDGDDRVERALRTGELATLVARQQRPDDRFSRTIALQGAQ